MKVACEQAVQARCGVVGDRAPRPHRRTGRPDRPLRPLAAAAGPRRRGAGARAARGRRPGDRRTRPRRVAARPGRGADDGDVRRRRASRCRSADLLARVAAGRRRHATRGSRGSTSDFLEGQGVAPWAGEGSLPLWLPRPEYDGMLAHDPGPAVAAGLRLRPLAETAPGLPRLPRHGAHARARGRGAGGLARPLTSRRRILTLEMQSSRRILRQDAPTRPVTASGCAHSTVRRAARCPGPAASRRRRPGSASPSRRRCGGGRRTAPAW